MGQYWSMMQIYKMPMFLKLMLLLSLVQSSAPFIGNTPVIPAVEAPIARRGKGYSNQEWSQLPIEERKAINAGDMKARSRAASKSIYKRRSFLSMQCTIMELLTELLNQSSGFHTQTTMHSSRWLTTQELKLEFQCSSTTMV